MVEVEIDMIVSDSLKALELYEKVFDIERIEVTNFPKGENEVVFSLYGVRFHMLDENPRFGLKAPNLGDPQTIWFNILVPNIKESFSKAINEGCTAVQEVTEMPDYGVSNATFNNPFDYHWMLHQIHKEVSFEERTKMWEGKEKTNHS